MCVLQGILPYIARETDSQYYGILSTVHGITIARPHQWECRVFIHMKQCLLRNAFTPCYFQVQLCVVSHINVCHVELGLSHRPHVSKQLALIKS